MYDYRAQLKYLLRCCGHEIFFLFGKQSAGITDDVLSAIIIKRRGIVFLLYLYKLKPPPWVT